MSTAIPELITAEVVTRLEQITTANGYFANIVSVDRVPLHVEDWTPKNLSIAVVQTDDRENLAESHHGNPPAMARDLTLEIKCIVRPSSRATTTYETTMNAMAAAVRKAITTPAATWYQMDGNAINTTIGDNTPFPIAAGGHAGVSITLTITYRISETDPFTVRA